jgi:hypothetical protein
LDFVKVAFGRGNGVWRMLIEELGAQTGNDGEEVVTEG